MWCRWWHIAISLYPQALCEAIRVQKLTVSTWLQCGSLNCFILLQPSALLYCTVTSALCLHVDNSVIGYGLPHTKIFEYKNITFSGLFLGKSLIKNPYKLSNYIADLTVLAIRLGNMSLCWKTQNKIFWDNYNIFAHASIGSSKFNNCGLFQIQN